MPTVRKNKEISVRTLRVKQTDVRNLGSVTWFVVDTVRLDASSTTNWFLVASTKFKSADKADKNAKQNFEDMSYRGSTAEASDNPFYRRFPESERRWYRIIGTGPLRSTSELTLGRSS